ncbi:hypothetical protein P175DRAFT_0548890 [Aspergillus ochraceoroseus IBT 24754]|uniref:Uncharacterized protein n=3 Tax=Aspergillus subgen. Nidulantes TaxID=2720870 RepID=A0A0F8X9U1_9EURO|nr:uncharacterized protein P175DRAFT_0548890 [Aspergillus ochraceoroseus IBT 24754]KKK26320.1 hypothetical protein ARAM_001570 [Aspergillus rambellii]PTU20421.1 hypothetical protein P175DRAFT_0548890 [Aspergillus ochraceoroseus IBT 24754]
MSTGAMATLHVEFIRYAAEDCTEELGPVTVTEGYCVALENFPVLSVEPSLVTGACEDASQSPVLSIYGNSDCATGLITTVDVGSVAQCSALNATAESLSLACA